MEFIKRCNNNQGFLSALLAIVSISLSVVAICISISTAKQQNKIALFEKRQHVYDDLDDYVNRQLTSWEFDLSTEYQNRGIARKMIMQALSHGKKNGATRVFFSR